MSMGVFQEDLSNGHSNLQFIQFSYDTKYTYFDLKCKNDSYLTGRLGPKFLKDKDVWT